MEENNDNTPDTHHNNNKRATTQKKKKTLKTEEIKARNTYRCSTQENKNPKEVEKYTQAQEGVRVSTFSHTQQKHSPI